MGKIGVEITNIFLSCILDEQLGEAAATQLISLGHKLEHVAEVIGDIADKAVSTSHSDVVREPVENSTDLINS